MLPAETFKYLSETNPNYRPRVFKELKIFSCLGEHSLMFIVEIDAKLYTTQEM